jgi:hypothetical protein
VAEIHEDYDEPCVCIAGYAFAVLLYGPTGEELGRNHRILRIEFKIQVQIYTKNNVNTSSNYTVQLIENLQIM